MCSTRMAGTNGHIHPESLYLWNELFPFPGGLARLRFLCSRLLPWFLFGRQFAPALRGPACFISLTAARDSQGIRWDVFGDRKSTRLNSSHGYISYAVFCLKKKNQRRPRAT